MSETTKCAGCGASMHRLTRWCQRCGKSAGNPQIPITYPTMPAKNIKPNPTNILPSSAQPEPGPTANAFSSVPQAAPYNSQPSPSPVAFNSAPQVAPYKTETSPSANAFNPVPSAAPYNSEPSPGPSAFSFTPKAAPPKSEPEPSANSFNFLPQSMAPATKTAYEVPEYAAVDDMAPAEIAYDSNGVWRDRNMMVAIQGAVFPDRCLKCNNTAEPRRITRKLYWHPPALYALAAMPLIYAIAATIIRKQVTLDLPLCTRHKTSRKMAIAGGILMIFFAVGLFAISVSLNTAGGYLISFLIGFGGIAVSSVGLRILNPTKIDNNYVWAKGVSGEFLRELPSV